MKLINAIPSSRETHKRESYSFKKRAVLEDKVDQSYQHGDRNWSKKVSPKMHFPTEQHANLVTALQFLEV